MEQTLLSQSSPVTAQPSRKRKRRLSSRRTKPSSHTRRHLYKDPVFSLKVSHVPSLLVNKKKSSRKGDRIDVNVQSYPDFMKLLKDYVTENAVPVSFTVNHSLGRLDYKKIAVDLCLSNLRSGRRDKIKNPSPDHCQYPIVCSSVEDMKVACNAFGHHWKVIMRPRPGYGDCKNAKLLAEMRKFQLKVGIDNHSTAQPSRKKSTKTRVNVSSDDNFNDLLEKYTNNAEPVTFNVSKDVDANSYRSIVDLLVDSNLKRDRHDKIKHPRSDHFPRPIVECETTEKMQNVYSAIGPYWRVVMCASEEENTKLFYQMDKFRMDARIEDHESDPLWDRA